jgi:hypothetical protein
MADASYLELLFLRKHLVKYLRANLDPVQRVHLPNWEDIVHDIAELLPRPELVALGEGGRPGALRIALSTPPYEDIPQENHDRIITFLEECFREEMFFFVKQQHTLLRSTLDDSIFCFLGQYGITEDDLSLEDLKRNWRRMASKRGKPRDRPGRPLKPYSALRWPRTRDKVRRMMPGWPEAKRPQVAAAVRTGKKPKPKAPPPPDQLSFFPPRA